MSEEMFQVPGWRLREPADIRAAIERIRQVMDQYTIGANSDDAQRPGETAGKVDQVEIDRATARAEVELVTRWWIRDADGHHYRMAGQKAAESAAAGGQGFAGLPRPLTVEYDFELRPARSRYFPAALDGPTDTEGSDRDE